MIFVKGNLPGLIVIGVVALTLVAGFFYIAEATDFSYSIPYFAPDHDHGHAESKSPFADKGFLYDESSSVSGSGDISIKGSFHDRAVDSSGWMKGSGSINYESLRNMNKIHQEVDFTQKSDLVFVGGQLKNRKSLNLPLFENGIGASVSERFNLSHVDKIETNMIRSNNRFNNTMVYDTALAFEGLGTSETCKDGRSIGIDASSPIQRFSRLKRRLSSMILPKLSIAVSV